MGVSDGGRNIDMHSTYARTPSRAITHPHPLAHSLSGRRGTVRGRVLFVWVLVLVYQYFSVSVRVSVSVGMSVSMDV